MHILIAVVWCVAILGTVTAHCSPLPPSSNVSYGELAKSMLPYDALLKNGVPQHIHFHCNTTQTQTGISNAVNTAVSQQAQQEQLTLLQGMKEHLTGAREHVTTFLRDYKYWIVGGCAASLYGYVCYTVYQGNRYAQSNDLWSSWKSSLELETLLSLPQKELAEELVKEVQRRYTNPANPTDFVSPLSAFLTALEKERKALEFYAEFNAWIQALYLSKIIPLSCSSYTDAKKRVQKLVYLKNIFITWAIDFKMAQAQV